jgi:chitin disaccharide deacetylase
VGLTAAVTRPPGAEFGGSFSAQLASELLGFAAKTRVLIINADDLGMYPAINAPVIDSIEQGVASSCSLMPPCPGAHQALRLLKARPHIRFGIHFTLVSESARLRFAPITSPDRVASLLDRDGRFFTSTARASLLDHARTEEVEVELRAQIDLVIAAGLAPTHLDWHALADGGREDIFELGLALAAEYGLAARVWLKPHRQLARQRGLPVVDHRFLDSFSLDPQTKPEHLGGLLHDLPPGLNEWAVHPGPRDPKTQAIDKGWRVRSSDLAYLTSQTAQDQLRQEGIVVIDYRGLQEVWRKQAATNTPR